jgi:hypothetical protein
LFEDITAFASTGGVNYAYELWNLDILNTTYLYPRKQYLDIDGNSTQVPFRVGSDGFYTLIYNAPKMATLPTSKLISYLEAQAPLQFLEAHTLLQFLTSLEQK